MRIVVTGASGFVGRALSARLVADGHDVVGTVRAGVDRASCGHRVVAVDRDINAGTDWSHAVAGADAVVHLVARTHRLEDRGLDALPVYRAINVGGTTSLLKAAEQTGVRRIVFVSSIKVNGERTMDRPFRHYDTPAPEDAYGVSKWEAEQAVREMAARSGMEAVVVRPPLVYGPGCRGNFARLRDAVWRRTPLPFAAVDNRRSMIAIDNLVDVLACCVSHHAAAGATFLVSDGEDLSTPELVRRMAAAMYRKPRLFAVPPALLQAAAYLTGRTAQVRRLLDSLQVDPAHARHLLQWAPPVCVDDGLKRAVQDA